MKHGNGSTIFLAAIATATTVGCAAASAQESPGQFLGDSAITTKVKVAMFNEPSLTSSEINVESFEGHVQLSGFVNARAALEKAVAVARGVGGVTAVDSALRLK